MNSIVRICVLGLALGAIGQSAIAESRLAILIANERYDTLRRATGADEILSLEQSLEANDFRVLTFENVSVTKLKELMADVPELIENADRTLIAVSGHVARTDRESWLLATDASEAGAGVIGMEGVALNALTDILSVNPGSAALLIGAPRRIHDVGAGIEAGYRPINIAQGVSVFFGPVDTLTGWAEAEFLNGNRTVVRAVERADDDIQAFGYLPKNSSFLPVVAESAGTETADDALYLLMEKVGTKESFQQYLNRFPDGRHADEARRALEGFEPTPEELAQAEETALRLSRDDRRSLQGDLTLLGHSTNGVDGIFGAGTRRAIGAWQGSNALPRTGYLNAEQIDLLRTQAGSKRASMRVEDDALWVETRRADTEDAYRAYLQKFPDGLYSEIAREELRRIEDEQAQEQVTSEGEFWKQTRRLDTADAYRAYLARYPNGKHASDAISRLVELEGQTGDRGDTEKARNEEQAYFGNILPRIFAERQLAIQGIDPGPIDGFFDDRTRAAVREFQHLNRLGVTGYIDNKTRELLF